jgi:hypothetical protein
MFYHTREGCVKMQEIEYMNIYIKEIKYKKICKCIKVY